MTRKKQINKTPPPAESKQQNQIIQTQTVTHQGPIPSPVVLQGYNDIVPGAAERILKMAENDQHHVHDMEKTALSAKKNETLTGQIFGIVAVLSAFSVVGYMSSLGFAKEAAGLGSAVIVGLAVAFITGRKKSG